jgi:outer membrane lipoprotein-sorting protein
LVLESTPKDPGSSVYGKKKLWVHPTSLIPLKVLFYDKKNNVIKELEVDEMRKISGFWTVVRSTLRDFKSKSVTSLTLKTILYDKEISDSYFTKRYLENPQLINEF